MPFPDPGKELTEARMKDPRAGDLFTEMYSFWLYVIGVNGNIVTTIEASAPCEFPKDGTIKTQTVEEFQKRFSYESIPGYSIRFVDGGHNVSGWLTA